MSAATSDASRKLIMVVEDDSLLRESLSRGLQDHGYQVIDAATVEDAISRAVTDGRPIDLLFTDVDLPGALDGIDLARWFVLYAPRAPVILTSGKVQPNPTGHCFLEKPVDEGELHRRIDTLLSPGSGTGSGPAAQPAAPARQSKNKPRCLAASGPVPPRAAR